MNIFTRIKKWLQKKKFEKEAIILAVKHGYQMDKIAEELFNSKRVKTITRIRDGFIIGVDNRGIIELHGIDNVIEEIILNPQNAGKP